MRCLDNYNVANIFKGRGQLFLCGGGGQSSWVQNSLLRCCQIYVPELSNISFKKKKRMQSKGIERRKCSAHWGGGGALRNAYRILVDILETRAERTW
jgi:hypothetical protein